MELDFDDSVVRGLRHYVRLVSQALGLHGECSYVQADEAACAYIALDGRLRRFPDRDVALLWDENHGWAAGIETHSGEDVLVVACLGQDLLPRPETVATWVRNLFRLEHTAGDIGHGLELPDLTDADVRHRLAAYATGPLFATTSRGADSHLAEFRTPSPG
jgi:hypothetical protein